jgi:hypothetical protein
VTGTDVFKHLFGITDYVYSTYPLTCTQWARGRDVRASGTEDQMWRKGLLSIHSGKQSLNFPAWWLTSISCILTSARVCACSAWNHEHSVLY